jgi:hypothetical protein
MLKIPAEYDRDTLLAKLVVISCQVSPFFTTKVSLLQPESFGG